MTDIWKLLINEGLTPEGAAGVMGNLMAESGLDSTIVERRNSLSGTEYTRMVDTGTISKNTFVGDAYGYGLAQWTYWSRKAALYDFAKQCGVSVGNKQMQVTFLLKELAEDYPSLLAFLKTSKDIYAATSEVCIKYERPAYNNIDTRFKYANDIYNKCASKNSSQAAKLAVYSIEQTMMPVIKKGSKGVAVGMVQFALATKGYLMLDLKNLDCDFGSATEAALNKFKQDMSIPNIGSNFGVVTPETWEKLYA